MLYVSLITESLRARPQLMFWTAALTQGLLWTVVPALFYAAPPGDLPVVLAVGHEYRLGSDLGPPLAFWLADIAYGVTGGPFGVYLLSQLCVIVAFWAIFQLGRATVGMSQAVLAVLLMVGIAAVWVTTAEFGPAILAMPIWAFVLLHYWRAVGEGRSGYWFLLALEIGLLLLTSYLGFLLFALLAVFTLATKRGRMALRRIDPWLCAAVALLVALPHLAWLADAQDLWMPKLARLITIDPAGGAIDWLRILAGLIIAHAGIIVFGLLASGWGSWRRGAVSTVDRRFIDPSARSMIYFFALLPALVAAFVAAVAEQMVGTDASDGQAWSLASAGPLVVCSGLAVIVAAGSSIRLYRQRLLSVAWVALLVGPPVAMVLAVLLLPWTLAVDLEVLKPADEMGRFFADSFQRRTGRPLAIVAGETRTAALIALEPRSRPSLLRDAPPERSPWLRSADIGEKGAVVVWLATDRAGTPPPSVKASFPDLVIEVPKVFERAVEGRLPLLRIGWGVIRPQAEAAANPVAPLR
ncbi:MAG: hypothetical protein QOD40_911 [Alphaproteobacteria bacterium]|nr:hypothetical protein [Alphaproteobacteria bacterium]